MSRRICIDTNPGYVVTALFASHKYLAVAYEHLTQFSRTGLSHKKYVYYIECYDIDDSYNLRKINNMYNYITKHENIDTMNIGLYIEDDNLYVINYLMYDYMYGHSEVGRKLSIETDKLQHTDISKAETELITKHVGNSCASYSIMDHECKYYTVSQAYDKYRTLNDPFVIPDIQIKSKQSSFIVKFNKSAHNKPTCREFTIHDATHVTQVVMRGEYNGLGTAPSHKLDIYPAFIADSAGRICLTYLRPDTKQDFTVWNLSHLFKDTLFESLPIELLDLIAAYC